MKGVNQVKCQYLGWFSREGCNEDSEPGSPFCHVHRVSGPSNRTNRKIFVGCLVLVIVLLIACAVGIAFGIAV